MKKIIPTFSEYYNLLEKNQEGQELFDDIINDIKKIQNLSSDDVFKLNDNQISRILIEHSDDALKNKSIKDRAKTLVHHQIAFILGENPELINFFKRQAKKFDRNDIADVILPQPQLIDFFNKKEIERMNIYSVNNILIHNPQLFDYFKNSVKFMSDDDIDYIIKKQPKLKSKIKDAKEDR